MNKKENSIKVLPHDKEIECAVLGIMLLNQDSQHIAMPRLFTDLFYVDANKAVFTAIRDLYDAHATIDLFTVYNQIKKNGTDSLLNGAYYLTELTNKVVSNSRLETHVGILCELYLKREIAKTSRMVGDKCYEDSSDSFELMNEILTTLEQKHDKVVSGKSKDITYYVTDMINQLYQVKEKGVLGLRTGIESIDWSIGGLCGSDMICIAARPSQGKTALALSITFNLSVKGDVPCAWFSLEMDGTQLVRRLVSMATGIDHSKIKDGRTSEQEDKMIHEASAKISSRHLFIEDTPLMTVRDIRSRAVILQKKYGIKYMIVDYLQLIENPDKNKSREQVVSDISRNLKILAKELNIPVIALSQLNRGVESRADKLPNLSDLRESGAIEQDSDSVIFIMRPEYYGIEDSMNYGGKDTKGLAVIKVDKNRHGETGAYYSHFDGNKMYFSNYL